MVVIRSGVETKDAGGVAKFYRIGSIPSIAAEDEEPSMIPTSDTFFWRVVNDPNYPTLVKASTWSVRNLEICNPDEGKHLPAPSNDLTQIDVIRNDHRQVSLKYKSGLTARVEKGLISPSTDGRLLYSFKTFGETLRCPDPMTSFPSSNVSLALRFHNHLTNDQASKLSFSTLIELEVDRYDNYDSIRKAIIAGFGFKTSSHDNTKPLLKAPLQGSFDMQLWVLPQIPDGKTLFRYSGDAADLYSFLNKSDVEEGDLSLFMEVHLIDNDTEVSEETAREETRSARSERCAKRGQKLSM